MMTRDNGFDRDVVGDMPFHYYNPFKLELGLVHAVFTREGGISQSPYNTLNVGHSVGDVPAHVTVNIVRALRAVGIEPGQVVTCHMVHGADVRVVGVHDRGHVVGDADGLATGSAGVFLFMRFADCLPLLFNDPVRRVVAIAHAGWRGTVQNVAGATVRTLVEALGCVPKDIRAALGPAIGPCCYRVGADVISVVEGVFGDTDGLLHRREGDSAFLDLWEANRRQLAAEGVKDIGTMDVCTACHNDTFFSHRADQGITGRFGAVIGYAG
jgi:polyphenol oxidase